MRRVIRAILKHRISFARPSIEPMTTPSLPAGIPPVDDSGLSTPPVVSDHRVSLPLGDDAMGCRHGSFFGPRNLIDLLRHRARCQGAAVSFRWLADGENESAQLTNAELDRQARAIATPRVQRGAC